MRILKNLALAFAVVPVLTFGLAGCGDKSSDTPDTPDTPADPAPADAGK